MVLFVLFQIFYHIAEFGNSLPVNFRKANILNHYSAVTVRSCLVLAHVDTFINYYKLH